MYRIMVSADDKPAVGNGRNMLGVRVEPDSNPDVVEVNGLVLVAAGGMSVNMCLCAMPPSMVPRRLRDIVRGAKNTGDDGRHIWRTSQGTFVSSPVNEHLSLRVDLDSRNLAHGFVEPAAPMPLSEYQNALAATEEEWHIDEQRNNECTICGQPSIS